MMKVDHCRSVEFLMNLQAKNENMQIGVIVALLFVAVLIPLTMSDAYAKCIDGEDCRRISGIESLKEQVRQDTPLSDITCPRYDHVLVEMPNEKLACLTSDTIERTWQYIDYRYIADYKSFRGLEKENQNYEVPFEIKGALLEVLSFENNSLIATTTPHAKDGALSLQIPYDLFDSNLEPCNLEINSEKTSSYIAVINNVEYDLDYEQDFHGTPVTLRIPLDENSRIIKITHICQDSQDIILDENRGGNDYGIRTNMGFSITEYPNMKNLDAVFQSCRQWERATGENFTAPDGTEYRIPSVGYEWFNSTHYIDNNLCDFIPMKKHLEDQIINAISEYCDSISKAGFDNPYEYWFANQTHYIDSDTCLWQSLDGDGISLVLPDHWKNTYEDD